MYGMMARIASAQRKKADLCLYRVLDIFVDDSETLAWILIHFAPEGLVKTPEQTLLVMVVGSRVNMGCELQIYLIKPNQPPPKSLKTLPSPKLLYGKNQDDNRPGVSWY